MRNLLRCFEDCRELRRVWPPLLALAAVLPLVSLAMPLVERQLIDGVVLARRLDLLPGTVAIYGGLWALSTAGLVAGSALRAYAGELLSLRLRRRLFLHSQTLSLAFSRQEHSGRTLSLFANDVPMLSGLFSTTLLGALGSVTTLVVGVVVMFSLSRQLAVAAGLVPPVVAGVAALVTGPLRPATRRAQEKAAQLTERLQENLAGIREVVAFGRERSQALRFETSLIELLRLRMRVTMMDTAIQTGQLLFSLTVTVVILGYGGYLVIQGQTTLGSVIAMRALFGLVFQPAGQLVGLVGAAQKALGAADRVYAFLDQVPRVPERPGARTIERVEGVVRFDQVGFSYEQGRPVLREVSFTARPGEMIALIGPSGAGKSTLVGLMARFYDPSAGRVLLDGVDLRDLSLAGLRAQIGMVFQDTFLFAATIRENVALGIDRAGEAEIVAAARAANAWEFIERLPAGLDTQVGERGVQLSEGQKQRVAIARALLRDPRILILDEPTSALDARSEHLLQSALANLMRGRTTFVIAHRLATVRRADRILVLDGGRIAEQGTHAELLENRGLYRELTDLQAAGVAHELFEQPGSDLARGRRAERGDVAAVGVG